MEIYVDSDVCCICVAVSGRRSSNFSVDINHGGFFVGHGRNRAYVNGRAIRYDHVEKVTWSPIFVESLVEEIGYEWQASSRFSTVSPSLHQVLMV